MGRARLSLALLLLASCAFSPGQAPEGLSRPRPSLERKSWAAVARSVTIHRDEWGVPHVVGPTDASVVLGLAFARAEDELERLERAVYLMLGRNAEVLGEEGLAWDRLVHLYQVPERARAEYETLPAEQRVLADAWAAGLNLYADRRRGPRLVPRFEPWHLLAQGYALHLFALAEELRRVAPELAPPRVGSALDGSNAFAAAPARTTGGHALLLANPHMPFEEVYEGHVHSEEGLRVSGALAYGRGALPLFGTNGQVAWTLTVNRPDLCDTYRVRFEPAGDGPGRRYRFGERLRLAAERAALVRVRGADGALEERELRWLETHHGPVLRLDGDEGLVLRVAGLERGGQLGASYSLARAADLDGALAALEGGGLLFHNLVAADAGGRIGYLYNALVPRRNPRLKWSGVLDGNDPGTTWLGYHPQQDLPQVLDPQGGWLQNCNSRPETTCPDGGPDTSSFPAYLRGADQDDGRVEMAHALLGQAEPFSFEAWCALPFDRRVFRARAWIGALADEVAALSLRDEARTRDLQEPLEVLQAWDGVVAEDSVAATLFLRTYANLGADRLGGPVLVEALERTLRELRLTHSAWRVAWGQVNRHQRARGAPARHDDRRPSWPVPGGHGAAGLAWTFLARQVPGAVAHYGYHGHSYLLAVELADPPRLRSVVPYGSSRDPQSPHFEDQAPLFARGELKRAWFTLEDVLAHAQDSYSPGAR